MSTSIEQLLSMCSESLAPVVTDMTFTAPVAPALLDELRLLLGQKNGCYGFVSALHIFPFQSVGAETGLEQWNQPSLWIEAYQEMAQDALFFAEDIFGVQFCLRGEAVCSFEPETGEFSWLAGSIEHWCALILEEYAVLTGYPLAQAWQDVNGALPPGSRLNPRLPFIAGGDFTVDNLQAVDSAAGMRNRALLASQIKQLPASGQPDASSR